MARSETDGKGPTSSRPKGSRPASGADWTRPLALVIAGLVLFPFLAKSGIWDPYELDAGDLARRIALNVFGAGSLSLPNAANSLPTLTDLKSGELGFTSMAVGFRLFGLHDWSGRLPLAVWGFAGIAVLYEFLRRLVHPRAGLYAAIALVTMPLYFMQARTMLGDVVTMAALAFAFCGLAGAMLDDLGGLGVRLGWLLLGVVGLVAGYFARGLLLGVAVPGLSVGLAWLVLRGAEVEAGAPSGAGTDEGLGAGDIFGGIALLTGAVALGLGLRLLFRASPDAPIARGLGFAILKKMPVEATFDLTIKQIGHALFPWSAFLPFALGRLFRAPVEAAPSARVRETGVRVALLVGAGVAYGAFTLLAPRTGSLPFTGPALLAAVAALAIFDLERGAPASRALSLATLLLGFVLYRDMVLEPEKALTAFVVDKPAFPKSFEHEAGMAMLFVLLAFAGVLALTWWEAQPGEPRTGFVEWGRRRQGEYVTATRELAGVWEGNLAFGLVVVEAALVGLGGMLLVGKRFGWGAVEHLPKNFSDAGMNAWWILPIVLATTPALLIAGRDLFRAMVDRSRLPRAAGALLAALIAGSALSFWYYPALAAQLSPKEAFESYARLHGADEPLGLLGVRGRAAVYYGTGEAETFSDASRAFAWLTERREQRRWLIIKADDLPRMNALYRTQQKKNLPVLDGHSSQILLVSSELGGHANENSLGKVVTDDPVAPSHTIDATFEDQLTVFGWDVTDGSGKLVDSVVPATTYHLRTYYHVLRPITGTWKAFVHIDGFQRRYNGDHTVVDGRYPMNLWQEGDLVIDDCEFQLEPNFTPGGYNLYFGFFSGETRYKVTRGPNQDNRVIGGVLPVR
jgi:hypothetical protein